MYSSAHKVYIIDFLPARKFIDDAKNDEIWVFQNNNRKSFVEIFIKFFNVAFTNVTKK